MQISIRNLSLLLNYFIIIYLFLIIEQIKVQAKYTTLSFINSNELKNNDPYFDL